MKWCRFLGRWTAYAAFVAMPSACGGADPNVGQSGNATGSAGAATGSATGLSSGVASGAVGITGASTTGMTGSSGDTSGGGATGAVTGTTGSSGSTAASGGGASGGGTGSSGSSAGTSGGSTGTSGSPAPSGAACGAGDTLLPPEPSLPTTVCKTLTATKATADEANLDTAAIQTALNACSGKGAVKLVSAGANNAFVSGALTMNSVTLWVDAGTTLYASRNPKSYSGSCAADGPANVCGSFLTVTGSNPAIVGDGIIDGQGGEPLVGDSAGRSWWDISVGLRATQGSAAAPALMSIAGTTNFVMYKIHIYNSAKFHVKLVSAGFVVWGVTLLTPSTKTNSQGKPLSAYGARNTDGIDPGGATPTTKGFLVCSTISVGDDQVAIKGGNAPVSGLVFAHNHFGTGHGMSIGSETSAGVSDIKVYDLTIDGSISTGGAPASDVNGLRIKSDFSRGGKVNNVTYTDVCIRDVPNPILLNPHYSTTVMNLMKIPVFTNIVMKDIHASSASVMQTVTLDGFDATTHVSTVSLDNVVVDNSPIVVAENANLTILAGGVSFPPPTGIGVMVMGSQGTTHPIDCSNRWVSIP